MNIQFNSAVTTGVIQSEMFCISSVKPLGQLTAALGEGELCQIVKGVNMGASVGQGEGS